MLGQRFSFAFAVWSIAAAPWCPARADEVWVGQVAASNAIARRGDPARFTQGAAATAAAGPSGSQVSPRGSETPSRATDAAVGYLPDVSRTGSTGIGSVARGMKANTLLIDRGGSENTVVAVQTGHDNTIDATVTGTGNALRLEQAGAGNTLLVTQSGLNNTVVALQSGQGNLMRLVQR